MRFYSILQHIHILSFKIMLFRFKILTYCNFVTTNSVLTATCCFTKLTFIN